MFISSSIDGYVKIWSVKKDLLREIRFPEPVYSVSFLNSDGDILVGHHGKVSTVLFEDYKPDEVKKLYRPSKEDMNMFILNKSSQGNNEAFQKLKMRDDEIKR